MRQRQLEKGLLKIMQTQPYEDISISDLCDQMDIPRKSFYRYFSNKDGALFALIDHTLMEFEQAHPAFDTTYESRAVYDLEKFFLFWYRQKDLLDVLLRNRLSGLLVERATNHAIHEHLVPGYLMGKDESSQHLALTFAVCGLLSMVMQWHQNGFLDTPEQMTSVATLMLTKPLISGMK